MLQNMLGVVETEQISSEALLIFIAELTASQRSKTDRITERRNFVGAGSEGSELKVAAALLELTRVGSRSNSTAPLLPAIKRQVKYSFAKPLYLELPKSNWKRYAALLAPALGSVREATETPVTCRSLAPLGCPRAGVQNGFSVKRLPWCVRLSCSELNLV